MDGPVPETPSPRQRHKEARLKREAKAKLQKMPIHERVDYILKARSPYAMWDKETVSYYIRELIEMNGGPERFRRLFPKELDGNIMSSWSCGRRSPTPFMFRLMIDYLERRGKGKLGDRELQQQIINLENELLKLQNQEDTAIKEILSREKRIKKWKDKSIQLRTAVNSLKATITKMKNEDSKEVKRAKRREKDGIRAAEAEAEKRVREIERAAEQAIRQAEKDAEAKIREAEKQQRANSRDRVLVGLSEQIVQLTKQLKDERVRNHVLEKRLNG